MPIETRAAAAPARSTAPRVRLALGARGGGRVSGRERMHLTERLELLLETGIPLHAALEALEGQAAREPLRRAIERLRLSVAEGSSFSAALAAQPEVFPRSYVNLVAAGETGGFLPEVLRRVREMDEKREELNSVLLSALAYPVFLALFALAVVVFILVFVFPKFAALFAMISDQLPLTTVLLMGLSDALVRYWAVLLLAGGAMAGGAWYWVRTPGGATALDRLAFGVPVVRDVVVQLHVVQFMRVVSLSLTHGVTLLDALSACREIARSPAFRRFLDDLAVRVREGGTIAGGFESAAFLPALVQQMVATGEETGNLAGVAARVADFYEREWRRKLAIIAKIAEPAMLLVMGVVVGVIVASLILPIFKLSRAVH